jgi:hypothetical protein
VKRVLAAQAAGGILGEQALDTAPHRLIPALDAAGGGAGEAA